MLVEIIIPTYNRIDLLRCMLASLMAQTCPNWIATVVIDNPDDYGGITEMISDLNCPNIPYPIILKERANDFGHTPREIGKQASTADYIVMSGDDNYYTPNFIQELQNIKDNPGVIYWDMVHSHYDYQYFECTLGNHRIDMGAFATRRDIAQSIELHKSFAADGEFVEEIEAKYPKEEKIKIKKILFVHN